MGSTESAQSQDDEKEPPEHTPHSGAVIHGHDMGELGLEGASDRLRMTVADLDVVHEALARADAEHCPACRSPHRK